MYKAMRSVFGLGSTTYRVRWLKVPVRILFYKTVQKHPIPGALVEVNAASHLR